MAKVAPPAGDGEGPASKKPRKRLVVVAAFLLVVIAAGAYKELGHGARSSTPVPGSMVNLAETTLNLPGGHLLQVSVAMELVQGEKLSSQETDALENDEIDVLSSFHYSELLSAAGKTAAQAALLHTFNLALAIGSDPARAGPAATMKPGPSPATAAQYVLAVYFTYFVMQ